jgi:hypothetical protein
MVKWGMTKNIDSIPESIARLSSLLGPRLPDAEGSIITQIHTRACDDFNIDDDECICPGSSSIYAPKGVNSNASDS